MTDTAPQGAEVATLMQRVLYEVKKVIVGQDHFLERVLVAILAQGHLLVEGVPGLAKTLTVNTLAKTIRGQFKRIQFTPDLVPADLVGTRIYNQKTGDFATSLGPVFTNLLLADDGKGNVVVNTQLNLKAAKPVAWSDLWPAASESLPLRPLQRDMA